MTIFTSHSNLFTAKDLPEIHRLKTKFCTEMSSFIQSIN